MIAEPIPQIVAHTPTIMPPVYLKLEGFGGCFWMLWLGRRAGVVLLLVVLVVNNNVWYCCCCRLWCRSSSVATTTEFMLVIRIISESGQNLGKGNDIQYAVQCGMYNNRQMIVLTNSTTINLGKQKSFKITSLLYAGFSAAVWLYK